MPLEAKDCNRKYSQQRKRRGPYQYDAKQDSMLLTGNNRVEGREAKEKDTNIMIENLGKVYMHYKIPFTVITLVFTI